MGVLELALEDAKSVPQTFIYKMRNRLLTLADQEEACKDPRWAYLFALDVKGANIEKCQDAACQNPYWAYIFARRVEGADIEKCQEVACQNPFWAYMFARDIKGADKNKLRKVCKGTVWEF